MGGQVQGVKEISNICLGNRQMHLKQFKINIKASLVWLMEGAQIWRRRCAIPVEGAPVWIKGARC